MSVEKKFRIRVRTTDGKTREPNQLKGKLFPHVDVHDAGDKLEFVLCASFEKHLVGIREKLSGAGLEEIEGGAVDIQQPSSQPSSIDSGHRVRASTHQARRGSTQGTVADLRKKPYGFVPLPESFTTREPVWHDGTCSAGRLSGEVRCELTSLTPLLVGWERRKVVDADRVDDGWSVPVQGADQTGRVVNIDGSGSVIASKSILCPLRAPWGSRPVLIPGDSLKGLLRHELGALLGAPMERVAERSYSYRPNSKFPGRNPRLMARLARVPEGAVEMRPLRGHDASVRVPIKLDLLPDDLRYARDGQGSGPSYTFDAPEGEPYRGGQGAGDKLNSSKRLHRSVLATPPESTETVSVPESVQEGYLATLRHFTEENHGHFSRRHPDVSLKDELGRRARERILEAAHSVVFQPGDLIWIEWDTRERCVVSLGWHYYYRWAYVDTVRRKGRAHGETEGRPGLFPLPDELRLDGADAPERLSAVRRLFGYTGDNEGSKGIGKGDHEQLMGRVSANSAIEFLEDGDTDENRFLPPTFLRELGMPRPSAVEYYLKQPYHPKARPSDTATLVTYGDAAGYDSPGELAGRKFYLDRQDAYTGEPWKDDSEQNRLNNDRSTLAMEASRPGRRFRFTVRFRDLDADELAAILVALCPDQFRDVVGGTHSDGYCSKLGYARPLGWGTVRVEAKELYLLSDSSGPKLEREADVEGLIRRHFQAPPSTQAWLDVHRHKHPFATHYQSTKGEIYTFHTELRAEHSRLRRHDGER